jgi:hypothetical protein
VTASQPQGIASVTMPKLTHPHCRQSDNPVTPILPILFILSQPVFAQLPFAFKARGS